MCGRYVVAYDPETLVSGFSLTRIQPFDRHWNLAPQALVPVVYESKAGERVGELMRWGLVPHWAADPSIGAKLNNARSEGMADKPSFRQAVRRRRCLLPASGFYEWQAVAPVGAKPLKQPWYISPRGAPFFPMAGLFEAWRPKDAAEDTPWLLTCCVVTTAPNAVMSPIHDRMPVMVPPEHWAAWLSRGQQDPAALPPLMQGLPDGQMQAWPVDRAVGRSSAQGPQLIEPLPGAEPQAGSPAPDRS
ncbi:SOS response-associated peptidase [Ideonella sp. A 288]|uniref:SOS response-associated peptidase n=1 Tax=Ideonella sp. A 288 TaxID=1962181 RepID=UPI000B4B9E22|nr:SOS response-associated peptidase [Ideonella sp. A 288]